MTHFENQHKITSNLIKYNPRPTYPLFFDQLLPGNDHIY